MFGKLLVIIGLVSAGLLLIVLNTTSPSTVGPWGILIVFFLTYVVVLTLITYFLWGGTRFVEKIATDLKMTKRIHKITFMKSYYFATVIALAPVILISLQSVGGVGIYETGLVLLFVVLGCVYVSRRLP